MIPAGKKICTHDHSILRRESRMKRKWALLGLVLAVALAVPLLAADKGDAAAGKAVYAKRCATCHGPDGVAKESIEKMFKVEIKSLGSKEVQAMSDADLQKVITEGKGKMKPVKDVTPKEVADLITFIRSLAKK